MRNLTTKELLAINGATLIINNSEITIKNDYDIPDEHFHIIEETFQKMIDGKINFYQASKSLQDIHICKYDTTHYFQGLLNTLTK